MQKVIHSQRMAGFLMLRGHRLVRLERDAKKPQYNTFTFIESEKLEQDISEFLQQKCRVGVYADE